MKIIEGRQPGYAVILAALVVLTSCTSSGSSAEDDTAAGSEGSCANRFEFGGVVYAEVDVLSDDTSLSEVGDASLLPCADGGKSGGDVTVFAIDGVAEKWALVAGIGQDRAVYETTEQQIPPSIATRLP